MLEIVPVTLRQANEFVTSTTDTTRRAGDSKFQSEFVTARNL